MAAIIIANDKLPSIVVSSLDTFMTIFRNDGTGHFTRQRDVFGVPGSILSGSSVVISMVITVRPSPPSARIPVAARAVIFSQITTAAFSRADRVFPERHAAVHATVDFSGNQITIWWFFGGPNKRAGVVALTNVGREGSGQDTPG
jgi:hypothetical protein